MLLRAQRCPRLFCWKDGSGFRWTSAFGEQQSLHVSGVLKNAGALQRIASRRPVGHGPRLLQRGQGLDVQVLRGPNLGFLPVHSKRLGAGSSAVCSVPNVGTKVS